MASISLPGGFTMLKTTRPRQSSPPREAHRLKQHDDVAIEADVIGSQLGATRPCVVWIHGGGLIFGWRKTPPFAEAGPDRSAFYLYCRQQGRWLEEVTGRDPIEAPGWFDRYCPVRNVTDRFPSTIVVHGDADTDVPHQESERLAARLAEVGVRHRFISMNGIGHGFEHAQPEQAQAVETEVADFLVSALG